MQDCGQLETAEGSGLEREDSPGPDVRGPLRRQCPSWRPLDAQERGGGGGGGGRGGRCPTRVLYRLVGVQHLEGHSGYQQRLNSASWL